MASAAAAASVAEAEARLGELRQQEKQEREAAEALRTAIEALSAGPEEEKKRRDLEARERALAATRAAIKDEEARLDAARGVGANARPPKRRLTYATQELSKFLKSEIEAKRRMLPFVELPSTATAEQRRVDLAEALFGRSDAPTAVYFRACYGPLLDKVLAAFERPDFSVLVAGTRGIGKSVFGVLVALELAARDKVVLYEHLGKAALVVPPQGLPASVAELVDKAGFDGTGGVVGGVYDLVDKEEDRVLRAWLQDNPTVYRVQDLGDATADASVTRTGKGKWLTISSPNAEKLKALRTSHLTTLVTMPLWSLEELLDARKVVYESLPSYAGYTPEEVKSRFEVYGGVPRWVLERQRQSTDRLFSAEDELQVAIKRIKMEDLESIFGAGSYITIPKLDIAGILVHVVSDNNGKPAMRLASKEIRKFLLEELLSRQSFTVSSFVNAVRTIPELGGYRGYALEQFAHRALAAGVRGNVSTLDTRRDKTFTTLRLVELPRLAGVVRFLASDMADLTALTRMQYVRPTSKIWPTLDSFCVMPWPPGAPADALVMFQVTVASDHVVDGSKVKRVQQKVESLMGKGAFKSTALVFVTDYNGVATVRTFVTDKGEPYKKDDPGSKITQYALHLDSDFEALANECRAAGLDAGVVKDALT